MDTEQHCRRLYNLQQANQVVRSCLREHFVGDYLAGQVTYNLGEYPARFSIAPTEYDERLLREFAAHGVKLIEFHEEWSDSQRRLGADKMTTHDPAGLHKFIDLVHALGMKIMVYASSGFFEATDPDFRPEWAHPDWHLVELYYDYALCSPASPSWRAYILPRMERILTEYGVDGLYDDMGYQPLYKQVPAHPSHISPAPETVEHDAALEDMLGLVMNLTHKHGGVLRIHHGGSGIPAGCRGQVYDYLWVGEGVRDLDGLRQHTKNHAPYVVPCPDMSRARVEREDDLYLHSVPYMQFPLRVDGRPCTGQRASVPGINYRHGDDDFWTWHMRRVWRNYQQDPAAPPMYGWWDSFPGRPEGRSRWLHHFDLYRPMVTEGTRVWIELGESTLFATEKPADLVASLFVNEETYLVLANYGHTPVEFKSQWTWRDREAGRVSDVWTIAPRSLRYLQRSV